MFKNKKFILLRHVTCLLLSTTLVLSRFTAYSSEAATFVHHHTDACYSTVTDISYCDGVYKWGAWDDNFKAPIYCNTCNTNTVCQVTQVLACNKCGRQAAYINRQKCPGCSGDTWNETSRTGNFAAENARCNGEIKTTRTVLACGHNDNDTMATVSLSPSTTGWTNKDITLNCGVTIKGAGFALAGAPYNFGSGYTANASRTVSQNGTYSVTVMAANGTTVTETASVNNIDKTAPSETLASNNGGWTNSGVTITASASDSQSGLAAKAYSFDGGAYGTSNSIFVSDNRTVTVSVMDNAGNVTTKSINVTNIDKTAPNASMSADKTAWTNGDVTVRVSASDNASGLHSSAYSFNDKGYSSSNSFTASANGTVKVAVRDNAGNVTTKSINITNIDKTAPDASMSADKTSWTNGDVTVRVSASDNASGLSSSAYSFNDKGYSSANSFTVSANGTVKVSVKDNAGNVTTKSINVTNIDKNKPTVSGKKDSEGWTNKNVQVTFTAGDSESGIAADGFSINGGAYSSQNTCTMEANGTVTATVKDNAGNTSSTTVEVKNIDKTAPTLELTLSTTDWIEEGLTVSATAFDGESGLPIKCFSVNGGDYNFTNSVFLTENGPVTFSVVDNAGNVTTKTVVVQNIGRDPAVVAREKLEKERAEQERIAAEKAAAEKAEKERIAAEKAAAEKAEKERIAAEKAAEKAEKERIAAEKAAAEKAEKERIAAEKAAAEKAEKERIAAEKAAAEKAASEKAIAEAARKLAEQQTQAEKEAAERVAKEQASREQAIKEAQQRAAEAAARAEAERLAAEKAAREESERIAAENAARAEAERIAAENAARIEADRIAAENAAKAEAEKAALEAEKKAKKAVASVSVEETTKEVEEEEEDDDENDEDALLPIEGDANGGGSDGGNGGNLIKFTDATATESPVDYFSMSEFEAEPVENTEAESGAESAFLTWLKSNSGSLLAGTLILLAGLFILSFFSYVYVSTDGKTKIVAPAKVKICSDRIIVEVQESKLKPNGRYLVFLSVWAKMASKKRPVYIKAGSVGNVVCAGDSLCFSC